MSATKQQKIGFKDYIAQQKEIERLQTIIDKFKNKPTKVAMTRSKQKAIEHMVKIQKPERFDTKSFHAHFQPTLSTGKDVLFVHDLQIGYDAPLSKVSLDVKKGDKIGILGGNGLGKSKSEQLSDPVEITSPTQLAILLYDVLNQSLRRL